MLQYLINVTDNSFIAVVVLSFLIFLFSINSSIPNSVAVNNKESRKIILISFFIGFVTALIYAILKRNTGYIVREYYDLGLLILWVILFIPSNFLSCFLFIKKPILKKEWCYYFFNICFSLNIAIVFALFLPNLFLFPFEFNVGMESIYNTDYLFKWLGFLFAILLMIVTFISLNWITKKLPKTSCFIFAHLILLIFSIQNIIKVAQLLMVRRLIPTEKWLVKTIIFISSNVNLFSFILIGCICALAIVLYIKGRIATISGKNPAQVRKVKADIRKSRRASIRIIIGAVITCYIITRLRDIEEAGVEISEADPVVAINGLIILPIEKVNDGNLHRFGYETDDGTIVRFIIIKKSENAYGVGLDACDICGSAGYYQRGNQVVCSRCDVVMNIATIGLPGGCNPVPLKYEINKDGITIKSIYLESEKRRFK